MISAFISHSTRDRSFVEQQLIPFLEGLGITPWYSANNITVGAAWERGIREALARSDWVVVVLSPSALQSEWVRSETHWALENKQGRVIPVRLAPCDPSELHVKLAGIQYADFTTDAVAALHRLETLFGHTPTPTTEGRGNGGTDWSARKADLPGELDAVLEELAARGKYQVVSLLARTGSGMTLLARHTMLKYEVILKSYWLPPVDAGQISALARQIQDRSRLRHPVLVTPIEVVPTESALFVVTQHVADAQSLGDLMREEMARRGSMRPETACQLLRQVTLGLAHAHAMGISHQSLDAWDILVNADNRVWVAGFERAPIYNFYDDYYKGRPFQTLRIFSPEKLYGKPLDSATDVYHVGIILCQLLTGLGPFDDVGELPPPTVFDINSIRPKVARIKDRRLSKLCLRCLQPRKEDRFSNSAELFAAFLSLQEKKPWWRLWT